MRTLTIVLASLLYAGQLSAQTVAVGEPMFTSANGQMQWDYAVSVGDVKAMSKLSVLLAIPNTVTHQVLDAMNAPIPVVVTDIGAFRQFRFDVPEGDSMFTVRLTAPDVLVKNANDVAVKWQLDGQSMQDERRLGPVALYDPSLVRMVFGAGVTVRQDDYVDFRIDETTNRLFVENDSPMRASGVVGGLFRLGQFGKAKGQHVVDALVSLEFAADSQRALDGFLFGATVGLNRYLSFGGGFALRRGLELSRGFRESSTRFVDNALQDDALKAQFDRFRGLENDPELYDGFPLVDPRTNEAVFPGSAITASYNRSWFLGVFIPLDIAKALQ